MFGGPTAPPGWLVCDGSAVSRTAYAALFEAVGTRYGAGNGSSTFNLPDMRGRAAVGSGSGYALGSKGGEESHALTVDEMPSHNHGIEVTNGTAASTDGYMMVGDYNIKANSNTGRSGGGEPHNNMQPYVALNYIIKF